MWTVERWRHIPLCGEFAVRYRVLLTLAIGLGTVQTAVAQLDAGAVYVPGIAAGGVPALGGPVTVTLVPEGGPPGSQSFTQDPLLGQLFGTDLRVDIGFEYLRPNYTNRATTLVVAPTAPDAFPVRGPLGDVTHDFAFIPRFGIEYVFPNSVGLGVGASGKLFTIQGDLRRTVAGTTGIGVLNAENTLTIGSANVLEGLIRFNLSRLEKCKGTVLEDWMLLGSVGARYAYVRQDFTTSLASGANLATLTATQDFTGFGVTGALGLLCPIDEDRRLALYGLSRGSVLAGRNNRTSTFSTVVVAPGASSSGQLTERKTTLIPAGEFEVGVSWGLPLRTATPSGALPPVLWLRGGFVTQIWGGLGLPDPPLGSSLRGGTFRQSSLVLYGFTILAGLSY